VLSHHSSATSTFHTYKELGFRGEGLKVLG